MIVVFVVYIALDLLFSSLMIMRVNELELRVKKILREMNKEKDRNIFDEMEDKEKGSAEE